MRLENSEESLNTPLEDYKRDSSGSSHYLTPFVKLSEKGRRERSVISHCSTSKSKEKWKYWYQTTVTVCSNLMKWFHLSLILRVGCEMRYFPCLKEYTRNKTVTRIRSKKKMTPKANEDQPRWKQRHTNVLRHSFQGSVAPIATKFMFDCWYWRVLKIKKERKQWIESSN